jgi:Flp pilus assembly pilin Flp
MIMIDAQVRRVLKALRLLRGDGSAATATEYAVMLAMIIVVAIGAIQVFGTTVSGMFVDIQSSLFS